jgi:aspartate aminotransferase
LSDEVYREFVYDGQKHFSMMSFPKIHNRVILLDSVSKRFSACGARIGCLASKNKEVIQAVTKFAQARLSVPMVEQLALIPLLKNPKKYTKKIVAEYKKRRDIVFKALLEIPGVICKKPKGAFYIIAKLPIYNSERFTKWLLTKFNFNGKTVMVAPAMDFYATKNFGKNEVRIAFVLSVPKLKEVMEVFKEGLKKYKRKIDRK